MKRITPAERLIIGEDGIEYAFCRGHKTYHLTSEFSKDCRSVTKYAYSCRDWKNQDDRARKLRQKTMGAFAAHSVPEEVELAKMLLTRMGYDLDQDIHQQFLEHNKHRL
jgi:hypothetical protein